MTTARESPEVTAASVKVRLLQDAVYSDDVDLWEALLRHRANVTKYFGEIGLDLVVHEEDGFAFLRQTELDEGNGTPRLFRRDKLSRGVAAVGVVLRERLLDFDSRVHDENRLVIEKAELIAQVAPFFNREGDEVLADKRIDAAIRRAEDLGLLRKVAAADTEDRFEVRRIVKARFPVDALVELRDRLAGKAGLRDDE